MAKVFKFSDVVLTATGAKEITENGYKKTIDIKYELTPVSMATVDLRGMTVSGEDYYVKKAVALGATKAK